MSYPTSEFDREEENLEKEYHDGLLTYAEYRKASKELQRAYMDYLSEMSYEHFLDLNP